MSNILTINTGSGTIKLALFSADNNELQLVYKADADKLTQPYQLHIYPKNADVIHINFSDDTSDDNFYSAAIKILIDWLNMQKVSIAAVSHRVVHGGTYFYKPILINDDVLTKLNSLIPLAPLHEPYNIQGIKEAQKHLPNCPQVACFDTAFHHTNPEINHYYAIPQHFEKEGIRRYGFHGLSYAYIQRQLEKNYPEIAHKKIIIAHLGQGASMCALNQGKSVLTSMGFTALDGLVMGTRSGAIDPGVLLYWMSEKKLSADDITKILYYQSGLKGLSGISSDMRTLLENKSADAKLAVDIFVQRVNQYIGLLAAELGGLDALVFTAGIGENAPSIRDAICARAQWMGVGSRIPVYVIPTNEEYMLAFYANELLCK
jgi:acetate kinase